MLRLLQARGDQKVLQLGYKKLTNYITHAGIFFDIFSCNINAYLQLLFSAAYAMKIVFFSLLTQIMPPQRSSVIHRL